MVSRNDQDGAVARLYAAAMGEASWISALEHLASMFGHPSAVLALCDAAGSVTDSENCGYDKSFAAEYYSGEIFANDPRTPFLMNVRPGSIYFDHILYDTDEMLRDPRCRASTDILGISYHLGAVMRLPRGGKSLLTLLGTAAQGHASADTIHAFRRLAPFAEQACALGQVAELAAVTQWALLEALAHKVDGVILLDQSGAPVFVNDAARAILAAGDGLGYVAGGFVARRGPETRRLNGLIHQAVTRGAHDEHRIGGHVLLTRPSGQRPYIVHVLPAPPIERFLTFNGIGCILHLTDLAVAPTPSRPMLQETFGLTHRETDLAIALVKAGNLTQAAIMADMALNTARNHLQSIFRKSATANQAEVVQLFGRIV